MRAWMRSSRERPMFAFVCMIVDIRLIVCARSMQPEPARNEYLSTGSTIVGVEVAGCRESCLRRYR
jgi:hypothetical protein